MPSSPQDIPEEITGYSYANILKGKGKAKATEPSPPKKVNIREVLIQSGSSGSTQKPRPKSAEQQPTQPTTDNARAGPTPSPSPRSSNGVVLTPTILDVDVEDVVSTYTKAMHVVYAWLAWHGFGSPGNTVEPSALLLYRAERARDQAERTGNASFVPGAREVWALEVALECHSMMREVWEAEYGRGSDGGVSGAGDYGRLV